MIREELINPKSIVVVGASNDTSKPGGRLLQNLLQHQFKGNLFIVNKNTPTVQGLSSYATETELPENIDLAFLCIPVLKCYDSVLTLIETKNTKAFIILSAGFGEAGKHGVEIEKKIVDLINQYNGSLIGPNCIGILNQNYCGVFTLPIPKLTKEGCDLISSSGATAVFLMEAGIPLGVKFSNVFSVGNSAQIGVEEVLEYMDLNYDPEKDSKIKLLYIESIRNPEKFLKHSKSLIKKGVYIAAIKSGTSAAGGRAAASHTGALSNSNVFTRALFKKAGIIFCSSRAELLSIASIFHYGKNPGKNFAIITHAGGSAVMLTDALSHGDLNVPELKNENSIKLLSYLNPGSSTSNPIDFLATGTAEQLGIIIDYCENKFEEIDAMIVVFGSPGLFDVQSVYNVLNVKLDICKKPIYPVLPSVINAQKEIKDFLDGGNINFPDEVELGNALVAINKQTKEVLLNEQAYYEIDSTRLIDLFQNYKDGFLSILECNELLNVIGINSPRQIIVSNNIELGELSKEELIFPCVMKVIGPIHKTETDGVRLNIMNYEELEKVFNELIQIKNVNAIEIQPMLTGHELFIGVKRELPYGHVLLCGFGGIYIELIKDFSSALTPVSNQEAINMIQNLRGFPILSGYRGKPGIPIDQFAIIIEKVSALVHSFPQISELDINPIIANHSELTAVDVRIKIN